MIRILLPVVSAVNALTVLVIAMLLRPWQGEAGMRACPSLAHANLAPEPTPGLRRTSLSCGVRKSARPETAGHGGFRRRIGRALLALSAAAFLVLAPPLAPASFAQDQATIPGVLQNLAVTPADGQITLNWEAPADDGGAVISSYEYRYAAGASVPADTGWTSAGTALTATVSGLDNGTQYAFEVRALNAAGNGAAAAMTATPATVPDAPQNLALTIGNGEVVLAWQAPAGDGGAAISRYEFRYAAGDSIPFDAGWTSAGTALTATVSGLDNGTQYAFEVRALNVIGNGPTAVLKATPATVPDAPQNLAAAIGDAEVALIWQAPAEDGGAAISSYEYRYAAGASVPADTVWTSAGTALTATVSGLDNGTPYAFEVRAVNVIGNGATAAATATPATVPDAPQIGNGDLAAAASNTVGLALAWQAPAEDGGAAISRYDGEFRYAAGDSVPSDTGWTSAGTALAATVSGLDNGTQYAFEVRAVNAIGNGATAAATATPATLPDAPQNLAAAIGDAEVVLTWQAPAEDGGAAISRYEFRYAAGDSIPSDTGWTSAGTALTATVSGLDNGTQYAFEVRAVNAIGNGAAAAAAATPATVPNAPQSLAVAIGDAEVALIWQAPAEDGGAAISSYEYRYAAGASVPADTGWTSAGTALAATVSGLDNGTQYAFEVRAVNAIGNGATAAAAATPATVPDTPQNLAAAIGDAEVVLTWQAPAGDGGAAISGYEFRYAAGDSIPFDTVWTSAGTALTVTVSDLDNGTQYAFEVRAVNGIGNGPTAALKATPVSVPDAPQNLALTIGNGEVALTWQAPASDGGAAISSYEYRFAAGASVPADTGWTSGGTALSVPVSGLDNGTQYAFEVRAVSTIGNGATAAATATPATLPDAPQNLAAVVGNTARSPWSGRRRPVTAAPRSLSYEYRYAAGASVPADTGWTSAGTALTVTVSGLDNGTQYAFEVRAVNGIGNGATAAATATPATVPDAPQNLAVVAGNGEVALVWQAPAEDGGAAISSYEYRYAAGDSIPADTGWTSAGTALTATVSGLDNGTQYAFEARAVSTIGNGATAAATATPATVPDAPQNLALTIGNGEVALVWQAPASDGGAVISSYEYRYAAGASVPADAGWTSAGTALTATVSGLDNGTQYAFEVRAVNGVGNSPAVGTTATPATVPYAPQNLALTIGNSEVALTWQAPAEDGGSALLHYEYRYAAGDSLPCRHGLDLCRDCLDGNGERAR